MHMFLSTIGGDGSQEYRSVACVFVRVFCKTLLFYTRRKNCNGKTKGLASRSQKQYTFENCIVLHKEAKNNTLLKIHRKCTCFFPLLAATGARSRDQNRVFSFEFFLRKVIVLHRTKKCNGKTKGLAILS